MKNNDIFTALDRKKTTRKSSPLTGTYKAPVMKYKQPKAAARPRVIMDYAVKDKLVIDYSAARVEYVHRVYDNVENAARVASDITYRQPLTAEQQVLLADTFSAAVEIFTVTRCGITRKYVRKVPR